MTTLPAAIVHPFPIVTPGRTVTFEPSQQSLPIVIGSAYSMLSRLDWMLVSWVAVMRLTPVPNKTLSPMVTNAQSKITVLIALVNVLPT